MRDIKAELAKHISDIQDFPKEGILFRDISPLLKTRMTDTAHALTGLFTEQELDQTDYFVGLDARGFIFAAAMATLTNKGFVMARKAGKLPPPVSHEEYCLEYGKAAMEMQKGSGNVIIIDDLLATGGTLNASATLCQRAGYNIVGMGCLINLTFLNDFEHKGMHCRSLLNYDKQGLIL